jgi:hypothetical protein
MTGEVIVVLSAGASLLLSVRLGSENSQRRFQNIEKKQSLSSDSSLSGIYFLQGCATYRPSPSNDGSDWHELTFWTSFRELVNCEKPSWIESQTTHSITRRGEQKNNFGTAHSSPFQHTDCSLSDSVSKKSYSSPTRLERGTFDRLHFNGVTQDVIESLLILHLNDLKEQTQPSKVYWSWSEMKWRCPKLSGHEVSISPALGEFFSAVLEPNDSCRHLPDIILHNIIMAFPTVASTDRISSYPSLESSFNIGHHSHQSLSESV